MSRKLIVYGTAALFIALAVGYLLFVQSRVRAVEHACATLTVGMQMSDAKKWIEREFLPIAFGFPRAKGDPHADITNGDILVLGAETPFALHTCGLTFRNDRIATITRETLAKS